MAGRKHKNRQRGQSTELLSELSSIRDLLGSEAASDIPLLDQVADGPAKGAHRHVRTPPVLEPLDESELPTLFSPVDEGMAEGVAPELSEADLVLLRPLQDLPDKAAPNGKQPASLVDRAAEQAHAENPFLPEHIRVRLTGDRSHGKKPAGTDAQDRKPESGGEQEQTPAAPAKKSSEEREQQRQQLIDRLVAKQLPELERQLRERIARMIDELEAKR